MQSVNVVDVVEFNSVSAVSSVMMTSSKIGCLPLVSVVMCFNLSVFVSSFC